MQLLNHNASSGEPPQLLSWPLNRRKVKNQPKGNYVETAGQLDREQMQDLEKLYTFIKKMKELDGN